MFPFPIARPQGCDIQTFYGDGSNSGTNSKATWNKPVGVSHVYMLLIGGGGNGDGTTGGGSGAVTTFYCAAQHIPNSLFIWVGGAETRTYVTVNPSGTGSYLMADRAIGGNAGTTSSAPAISAMGFYQSVTGQAGSTSIISASSTTFLSGGAGTSSNNITGNYGYVITGVTTNQNGVFQMQPIIVGLGGRSAGKGGIGCGGGGNGLGAGGPGMVLIASW